jgi:hypothetical protein
LPKLTKRVVDGLRPAPDREVLVWDTELRALVAAADGVAAALGEAMARRPAV